MYFRCIMYLNQHCFCIRRCDMTIEEMKSRKIELGYTNRELSELSGVPEITIQKVLSGKTKAPRKETIQKLERIFKKRNGPAENYAYSMGAGVPLKVREVPAYHANQGNYTLDDYFALPDDQRVELIDGVFYDMASPSSVHQLITGFIYKKLLDYIESNKGNCIPVISPMDVQLNMDNRNMLQPDVLVICSHDKIKDGRIYGAPDLAVEVLSRSTRKKDMHIKLYKYSTAGVREYWIVDTDAKSVIVYDLEHDAIPKIYGFNDEIPVLIWGGKCKIGIGEFYNRYKDWIE